MKKYNLAGIMKSAWNFFRKAEITFADALRMAWQNAKRKNEAKAAAGITETIRSWYEWYVRGREVIHESRAVLKVTLMDPTTKNKTRVHCYFTEAQTRPIEA